MASSHEISKRTIAVGKGVAAALIEAIHLLDLQVVPDDDDHGCIKGLPYSDDENWNLATELADRLLEISNIVSDM